MKPWRTNAVVLMSRLTRAYQRIGRLRAIKREAFAALEKVQGELKDAQEAMADRDTLAVELAEERQRVGRRDAALQVQADHAWAQTNKANALDDQLKKLRQTSVDELVAQAALIDALDPDNPEFNDHPGDIRNQWATDRRLAVMAARERLAKVKAATC